MKGRALLGLISVLCLIVGVLGEGGLRQGGSGYTGFVGEGGRLCLVTVWRGLAGGGGGGMGWLTVLSWRRFGLVKS